VTTPLPNIPAGVEVSIRRGAQGPVYILVNLSKQPQTISLPGPMSDVLEGGSKSSVDLPVYGVALLAPPH
jgi:beta-galactosidase